MTKSDKCCYFPCVLEEPTLTYTPSMANLRFTGTTCKYLNIHLIQTVNWIDPACEAGIVSDRRQ